jgi:hypothetical protein
LDELEEIEEDEEAPEVVLEDEAPRRLLVNLKHDLAHVL